MVRFQCIHCGGRIVVQDRHMDRLARCPECGSVTHPLAEQLNKSAGAKPKASQDATGKSKSKTKKARKVPSTAPIVADTPVVSLTPDSVRCDNCGQQLGKLQRALAWNEHRVCGPCQRALSLEHHGGVPTDTSSSAVVSRTHSGVEIVDASSRPGYASHSVGPALSDLRRKIHVSDFTLAFWGACLGLCATAFALYAIITVLQSLSILIVWALVAVGLVAGWFWIKRGMSALRTPRKVRTVDSIVRTDK